MSDRWCIANRESRVQQSHMRLGRHHAQDGGGAEHAQGAKGQHRGEGGVRGGSCRENRTQTETHENRWVAQRVVLQTSLRPHSATVTPAAVCQRAEPSAHDLRASRADCSLVLAVRLRMSLSPASGWRRLRCDPAAEGACLCAVMASLTAPRSTGRAGERGGWWLRIREDELAQ